MSKKFGNPVVDRGMVLAVKLFRMKDFTITPAKLAAAMKEKPYSPKKKNETTEGFTDVKVKVKTIRAEFVASFNMPYLTYNPDSGLTPGYQISVDKGIVFIKMDRGTIEVRASGRVAGRVKSAIEEISGGQLEPLNLNGGTKKLYDLAESVSVVTLTGLTKSDPTKKEGAKERYSTLSRVEFGGEDIKTEDEIGLYTRKYQGKINRFRASFKYPSGVYKTVVNADVGSLLLYRGGEGPYEKDLSWIVEFMEDNAPDVKKSP